MFIQLLKEVLNRKHIFAELAPILKRKFIVDDFDQALTTVIIDYYYKYKQTPALSELELLMKSKYPEFKQRFKDWVDLPLLQDYSDNFLKDEFIKSIRNNGIEKIIVDTAKQLDTTKGVNYNFLWNNVRDLVVLTQDNNLGLPIHQDISNILTKIRSSAIYNRMPIKDWGLFNYVLGGGLGKEEIFLFVAPSGRGKTTFLVNLTSLILSSFKKNILCITTELLDHVFSARIYRRLLKLTREEFYELSNETLRKRLARVFKYSKSKVMVKYVPPNKLTPKDILGMIEQFENKYGEPVDMVVLDYLDKLKVGRGHLYRLELQDITEELRAIALEKSLAMVTATQANRESMKKGDTTGVHVSEGIGKHQSSDVVIVLQQTEDERKEGLFRLRFDKVRELAVPQSKMIHMKINPSNFVIEEERGRTLMVWQELGFKIPSDDLINSLARPKSEE